MPFPKSWFNAKVDMYYSSSLPPPPPLPREMLILEPSEGNRKRWLGSSSTGDDLIEIIEIIKIIKIIEIMRIIEIIMIISPIEHHKGMICRCK